MSNYYTRGEAVALIEEAAAAADPMAALLDLQQEWIGHRDHLPEDTAESQAQMLREWIDESIMPGETGRDRAPLDSDPTDIRRDSRPFVQGAALDIEGRQYVAFGFLHEGVFIHDPRRSSCGRFEATPADYGLTEEQAQRLEILNANAAKETRIR